MKFEYDLQKSKANQLKHGISFEETKALWSAVAVEIPARTSGETRFLRIGKIGGKFYSCVFTVRNSQIRLISARRSRAEEEIIYAEIIQNENTKESENKIRGI